MILKVNTHPTLFQVFSYFLLSFGSDSKHYCNNAFYGRVEKTAQSFLYAVSRFTVGSAFSMGLGLLSILLLYPQCPFPAFCFFMLFVFGFLFH